MRKVWRGPRLLVAIVALSIGASASVNSASLSISPSAEPAALAKTLQSKNATEAAASAYWLGFKGSAAVPVIPNLVAALGDDRPVNPRVYRPDAKSPARSTPGEEAAEALARIGKPAIDPLITTLRASSSAVARKNAAWALGQIDTAAHSTNAVVAPSPKAPPQNF
jgi:HEAT repeat protein